MPHIAPLQLDAIADPELRALVDEALALGVPDETFVGIIARVPDHAKALLRAMLMSHAQGSVDHRLKEIIRVMLAGIARDPYFSQLRSRRAIEQGLTEDLIAAVSKRLGFKRTGPKIRDRVATGLNALVADGRLGVADDTRVRLLSPP